MPIYEVETLEKWETIAYYTVTADSLREAVEKVIRGGASYDYHKHPGNDDEFIEVFNIEEVG